jgi:hypothetical protein
MLLGAEHLDSVSVLKDVTDSEHYAVHNLPFTPTRNRQSRSSFPLLCIQLDSLHDDMVFRFLNAILFCILSESKLVYKSHTLVGGQLMARVSQGRSAKTPVSAFRFISHASRSRQTSVLVAISRQREC